MDFRDEINNKSASLLEDSSDLLIANGDNYFLTEN
jgi:hypothetical protein